MKPINVMIVEDNLFYSSLENIYLMNNLAAAGFGTVCCSIDTTRNREMLP
ncbi:MAG: hypothetical protein AB9891_12870 [Anaerolineaceae bacterium]